MCGCVFRFQASTRYVLLNLRSWDLKSLVFFWVNSFVKILGCDCRIWSIYPSWLVMQRDCFASKERLFPTWQSDCLSWDRCVTFFFPEGVCSAKEHTIYWCYRHKESKKKVLLISRCFYGDFRWSRSPLFFGYNRIVNISHVFFPNVWIVSVEVVAKTKS